VSGEQQTPGTIAELYLGNILYALERCAMSLEAEGDREGPAFYRGIARALAEARGATRATPPREG
jgi:hypothetical protein